MLWTAKKELVDKALHDIGEFEKAGTQGMFYGLPRASVARGLRERVQTPSLVDQNNASVCGPAAFIYCLLNCHPEIYVRYVTDLYETGEARLGDMTIKPSTDCMSFRSDPSQIADVDWIALVGLRDSENLVLSYSSTKMWDIKEEVAGGTSPHILAKWFDKAGFAGVTNETNVYFSKGLPTLLKGNAQTYLQRYVCLLINDNMVDLIDPDAYKKSSTLCNHWVVLQDLTSYADDDIRFSVYSQGGVRLVPGQGRKMSRDQLSGNFYGFVSACRF